VLVPDRDGESEAANDSSQAEMESGMQAIADVLAKLESQGSWRTKSTTSLRDALDNTVLVFPEGMLSVHIDEKAMVLLLEGSSGTEDTLPSLPVRQHEGCGQVSAERPRSLRSVFGVAFADAAGREWNLSAVAGGAQASDGLSPQTPLSSHVLWATVSGNGKQLDGAWFSRRGQSGSICAAPHLAAQDLRGGRRFRALVGASVDDDAVADAPCVGLVNMCGNLTNVCYQNSLLQVLYATRPLRHLVLSQEADLTVNVTEQSLLYAELRELFARLAFSARPVTHTKSLRELMPMQFQDGTQQDVYEFSDYLLENLGLALGGGQLESLFGSTHATLLRCHTCGQQKSQREFVNNLLLNMADVRYNPITSIRAVAGSKEGDVNVAPPPGYERIKLNLNQGRSGAPPVYLCVSRDTAHGPPVTELTVTSGTGGGDAPIVTDPETTLVDLNLNFGGDGSQQSIYLLYSKQSNGSPITEVTVLFSSVDAQSGRNSESADAKAPEGFRRIGVDLNKGQGSQRVYLAYRYGMPIRDVTLGETGVRGYSHFIDVNVNPPGEGNRFLCHTDGGAGAPLTGLQMLPDDEAVISEAQRDGWRVLTRNLNGAVLLSQHGRGCPIIVLDVYRAPRKPPKFSGYERLPLWQLQTPLSINDDLRLAKPSVWKAEQDTRWNARERFRREVLLQENPQEFPVHPMRAYIAPTSGNGSTPKGTALGLVVPDDALREYAVRNGRKTVVNAWRCTGWWTGDGAPAPCAFMLRFYVLVTCAVEVDGYLWNDSQGTVTVSGSNTTASVQHDDSAIEEIAVLQAGEEVPDSFQLVEGALRNGVRLAVRRYVPEPSDSQPAMPTLGQPAPEEKRAKLITSLCVIHGEVEAAPPGYTLIEKSPAGAPAYLTGDGSVPLMLCVKQAEHAVQTLPTNDEVVTDVILLVGQSAPKGYKKVASTIGGAMEADLSTGGQSQGSIFLGYRAASMLGPPVAHPVCGHYDGVTLLSHGGGTVSSTLQNTWGRGFSIVVGEPKTATIVKGEFAGEGNRSDSTRLHGLLLKDGRPREWNLCRSIQGMSNPPEAVNRSSSESIPAATPYFVGSTLKYDLVGDEEAPARINVPTELCFDATRTTGAGWFSGDGRLQSWELLRDTYCVLGFKRDYASFYDGQELQYSDRVGAPDVPTMLSSMLSPRVLAGADALECDSKVCCGERRTMTNRTVVTEPPSHLILTMKRMWFDWKEQKAHKALQDMDAPLVLNLPYVKLVQADGSEEKNGGAEPSAGGGGGQEEAKGSSVSSGVEVSGEKLASYGLYGIIVHSGLGANSGHYYAYARPSAVSDGDSVDRLAEKDIGEMPWVKYDDSVTKLTSWAEIRAHLSKSLSDTAYMLFYKQLKGEEDPAPAEASDGSTSPEDKMQIDDDPPEAPVEAEPKRADEVRFEAMLKDQPRGDWLQHVAEDNTVVLKDLQFGTSDFYEQALRAFQNATGSSS